MPDYSKGEQYCIRSHQTNLVYHGSTIQPLSKRFWGHRHDYKKWLKGDYHYVSSYEIMKYDDCYIELVEVYPCDNKKELERREGQLIREDENSCNKCIPGRTSQEWREDNKEYLIEYFKQYHNDHRDKRISDMKIRGESQREEKKVYDKKYRSDNREKKMIRDKKYFNEKSKIRFKCICGSETNQFGFKVHKKSLKHQEYINRPEPNLIFID